MIAHHFSDGACISLAVSLETYCRLQLLYCTTPLADLEMYARFLSGPYTTGVGFPTFQAHYADDLDRVPGVGLTLPGILAQPDLPTQA